MSEDVLPLDADDSWICSHVDATGTSAMPTRLRLSDTHDWPHAVHNARRWVNCPDCGTRWRAWVELREVKPTVYWRGRDVRHDAYRYRHAPLNDLDELLVLVRRVEPRVSIDQVENAWPADDDGLWTFTVPDGKHLSVQVEAPFGRCPFLIEGGQCRTGHTIEEAARCVVEELGRREPGATG